MLEHLLQTNCTHPTLPEGEREGGCLDKSGVSWIAETGGRWTLIPTPVPARVTSAYPRLANKKFPQHIATQGPPPSLSMVVEQNEGAPRWD